MKGYRVRTAAKEGGVTDQVLRDTGLDMPALLRKTVRWPGMLKTTPVLEVERDLMRRMSVFRYTATAWQRNSRRRRSRR